MNCLLVAHHNGLTGGDRCFIEQVKAIREIRADIEINIALPHPGVMEDFLREFGVNFFYISQPSWLLNHRFSFKENLKVAHDFFISCMAFRRLIVRINPDFVLTNTMSIPAAALVCKALRKKHFWFIHEFGDRDHGLRFMFNKTRCMRWITKLSHKVVVNSTAVAGQFKDQKKIIVLHYGMDIGAYVLKERKITQGARLLISNRVMPAKGQYIALQALKILIERKVPVSLTLLGWQDDDYTAGLLSYILENNLEAHVTRMPFIEDPLPVVYDYDILLVCSRCEAFGRVTVEAMKLGVVVVAAATCGTLDIIADGETGILYDRDNETMLAEKIQQLLTNQELYDRIQLKSFRSSSHRFSMKTYEQKLKTILFNQMLNA